LVHSGSWQIGKKDFQTERGNRSTHINSIISTPLNNRNLLSQSRSPAGKLLVYQYPVYIVVEEN
jgi:hypothetical protein